MSIVRALGKTCFAAAYTAVHARPACPGPFIVCYHRVVEDFRRSSKTSIPSMLISTAMLERHIDWLARRFSIVSLDEIGRQHPKPAAAITFDDGYADVYHHAYPLLQRKGVPAAVFVVTGLVGTGRPQLFDRLYMALRDRPGILDPLQAMTDLLQSRPHQDIEKMVALLESGVSFDHGVLEEFAPLTWDMIATMHGAGMTIGSHTKSHTLLTSESLETVANELTESRKALEARLKAPVNHFAYPDGRFNSPVVEAVHSAGYRFAYGICHRRDGSFPLLTIPRKVLWERACLNALGRFSPSVMNCQAHRAFDREDRCEHDHGTIN